MEKFKERKKLMKKRIINILLITVLVLSLSKPNDAEAVLATEFTQVLNHVELVIQVSQTARMLVNQIQMISNQIEFLKSIATNPNGIWDNIVPLFAQLHNVVQQGQALAYNLQNISQVFQTTFPGYVAPQNFINEL